jgi:hypothetical protein
MQIQPFYDYGFGLGVDPFSYGCCGYGNQVPLPNAPPYTKGTPYYKQIIIQTGGNPGTNLDELLTKGYFTDGDVIKARIGTYNTNEWMLLIGTPNPDEVVAGLAVVPQDYNAGTNNVYWRLTSGNIS